ncbi:MAG TPA: hypothetical protein VHG51_05280 [Longimicrobiaceae bacterium]|nr:hypothetical protein [Longimicrobiaceae bacterium]
MPTLPVRPFTRVLLLRALLLWVGVRLVVLAGGLPSAAGLAPTPRAALLVVAVVGVLGLLEARRRNEVVFLANLGVGRASIAAFSALPALALEILAAVGLRL